MYWANFLHIYQPPNQMADILERIVNESYRKLIEGLRKNPRAKITLNINAGLTEQLAEHGYNDVIDGIKFLLERGQIELTETAKYHPFLPLTPYAEILRQINLNFETNRHFFGPAYKPVGFFPPEMAYNHRVADAAAEKKFQWIIIDEIAYNGKIEQTPFNRIFSINKHPNLNALFRERRLSNLIMSAVVRNEKTLLEVMGDELKKNRYLLTAMDGETFGHHRPGLDKLLFSIFNSKKFRLVTISELIKQFPPAGTIAPVPSNWASAEIDIEQGKQFLSWDDPDNPIHEWQWELTSFALKLVERADPKAKGYAEARDKMDRALHSCQYWWACAKPWWSLEMIEAGAFRLFDTVRTVPNAKTPDIKQAFDLYQKIVLKAFEWQRTGYIRELAAQQRQWARIPFQNRAKAGEYPAFMEMMEKEMNRAAKRREFEKAILWRDAMTKLENKTDAYDAIHVVDQLRANTDNSEVEALIKKYKKQYQKIRGGQPEQRG